MTLADTDTTLRLVRAFAAPREAVFDAWMTHDQFQAWIGPEGVSCEAPLFEPRVGGRYRIAMKLSNGQTVPVGGEFRSIERPTKVVFTWGWDGDPVRQSLITLTFAPKAGGTEMTLTQEGLGTPENRDDHGRGWSSAFNKLERFLAGNT